MAVEVRTRAYKIFLNILVWLFLYVVFYHLFLRRFEIENSLRAVLIYSLCFSVYLVFAHFHLYFLLPRFYGYKKYYIYCILLFLCILLVVTVLNLIVDAFGYTQVGDIHKGHNIAYFTMFSFLYLGVSAFMFFYKKINELEERALNNEKDKISAELNVLKAQINPHLLFNTLNNIYSLSLEKSKNVSGMILKLSDLMSYVLYECKKSEVSLNHEIEFIENYITLEKMRFEDTIDISFIVEIENPELRISPLLFIPFIENAFKHSTSSKGKRRMINIQLTERDKKLHFITGNSINSICQQKEDLYSGIGIQNVTKRLRYLYPENYKLHISCSETTYIVDLEIKI